MRIGIDIVHIPRIKKTIGRWGEKFIKRVYSKEEIEYCKRKKDRITCYAGRFAAKEAIYKTLGRAIPLKSISIKSGGIPSVYINGKKMDTITISISHNGEYAIAVAVHYSSSFT